MGVSAIDSLHGLVQVVLLWVEVLGLSHRGNVAGWFAVSVRWEQLCERVSHLELSVERSVEVSLAGVQRTVLNGSLRSRRQCVIVVLVRQTCLIEGWVLGIRAELTVVVLGLLRELLNLSETLIILLHNSSLLSLLLGTRRASTAVGNILEPTLLAILHQELALGLQLYKSAKLEYYSTA